MVEMKSPSFARVRIRVRAPEAPIPNPERKYPSINRLLPSWVDAEIFAVAPDGTEYALPAKSVSFSLSEGAEPASATIVVYPDEIDVEAMGVLTTQDPSAKPRDEAEGLLVLALAAGQSADYLTGAGRAALRRLERAIRDREDDPIGRTIDAIQHRDRSER
jgi:hypothetical protein